MFRKEPEATGRENIVAIRAKREQELNAPAVQGEQKSPPLKGVEL